MPSYQNQNVEFIRNCKVMFMLLKVDNVKRHHQLIADDKLRNYLLCSQRSCRTKTLELHCAIKCLSHAETLSCISRLLLPGLLFLMLCCWFRAIPVISGYITYLTTLSSIFRDRSVPQRNLWNNVNCNIMKYTCYGNRISVPLPTIKKLTFSWTIVINCC